MNPLTERLAATDDGWRLVETGWDPDRAVALGSNFLAGNGYLGYRGTSPEQGADDYVALVVSDTYDCADGHWTELTTAPNPLLVAARVDGVDLAVSTAADVEASLDLRTGTVGIRRAHDLAGTRVDVAVERFASYDDLHLLAQRWTLTVDRDTVVDVDAGIDAAVWSLNGAHLPSPDLATDGPRLVATGTTVESGVEVAVVATTTVSGATVVDERTERHGDRLLTRRRVAMAAGETLVVETVAAVRTSSDGADPIGTATGLATVAAEAGWDRLRATSDARWAAIWDATDVRIDGSPTDDALLRFAAYHNRICTPAHTDHLPIGARGLSCQAYQGAAFWDQEVYNLPAFLFTEPDVARSVLVYRHRTLDGARRKAARLGHDGAFYAWISGRTGDELCPDVFFTDVLTGRPIRNHFNDWQMHVAPDVVTTIARYVEVTDDVDFLAEHGAEVAFEVARFLRSFVRFDDVRATYHCIRLLGPDEWHENVDDNAFTNHQVHAALGFAIDAWERLAVERPDDLATLAGRLALTEAEVDRWRHVREHLFLPAPDPGTRLVEQFDGFFDLEDVTPAEVATRLLDPQEYWGWPNGVAVATQVSKQADVPMLLWLHADRFDDATVEANYRYYEPRCSHHSSLSHAAFGMVATRIGALDDALAHFRATATVDLRDANHSVVAGTFIGGIHTAACGGTHQLAVQGFGGLGFGDGRLTIEPALPPDRRGAGQPPRRAPGRQRGPDRTRCRRDTSAGRGTARGAAGGHAWRRCEGRRHPALVTILPSNVGPEGLQPLRLKGFALIDPHPVRSFGPEGPPVPGCDAAGWPRPNIRSQGPRSTVDRFCA